ncbi:MAG: hypothetical protein ACI8UO_005817 [Verrucomicrobiales bacterium]|jgi:hypothetical protein
MVVVVEKSFEAAAEGQKARMAKLTPEERVSMTEILRRQLYPNGVEPKFHPAVEVVQR